MGKDAAKSAVATSSRVSRAGSEKERSHALRSFRFVCRIISDDTTFVLPDTDFVKYGALRGQVVCIDGNVRLVCCCS